MLIQGVDLASKAWATCLGDESQVHTQFNALNFAEETDAVSAITHLFRPESGKVPDWLLIEDLPFGTMPNVAAKDVSRFQGRIIERMAVYNQIQLILFIQPMEWQRYFKVNRRGLTTTEKDNVYRDYAKTAYNYDPPNLVAQNDAHFSSLKGPERSKVRGHLKKLMTDHIAAFLIMKWAHEVGEEKMLASKSVQRYER